MDATWAGYTHSPDSPTTHPPTTCARHASTSSAPTCACLRLPYTAEADLPADDATARHTYQASREVRHTIIRIIRDHIAVGPEDFHASWQGYDLDFTGVVFDGGDFTRAVFATRATVSFRGAEFSGSMLSFQGARFTGGTVDFQAAQLFAGTIDLRGARFAGGKARFMGALFSGGTVDFSDAVGSAPLNLLAAGQALPMGLCVPAQWSPTTP